MANLVITAANVEPYADAVTNRITAGGTITQGQPVYVDGQGRLRPTSNAAEDTANAVGIALTSSSRFQPCVYQSGGTMDLGATLAVGTIYVVANTAGGIHSADNADISGEYTTGDYPTILGIAREADIFSLNIHTESEPLA